MHRDARVEAEGVEFLMKSKEMMAFNQFHEQT